MASLETRQDPIDGAAMWEMIVLGDWQDVRSVILPLPSFEAEVVGRATDPLAPRTQVNTTASGGRLGNPFVRPL